MADTIAEARTQRMMGSTLTVEDRTNPVNRFSCGKCYREMFFRWFDAMRSWPYCCLQLVCYHGPISDERSSRANSEHA